MGRTLTKYAVHIDDGEVTVAPLDSLDVVDVPEDLEEDFVAFVQDEQPSLYWIEEWLFDQSLALCTSDDPDNHQGDTCPVHEGART